MTKRKKTAGKTARKSSKKSGIAKGKKAARRMLMNVLDPEEVRVAIAGPKGVEELYVERVQATGFNHGNIYKGIVTNVEASLQAAFVDIGGEKNGFLHVSDVVPPCGGYEDVLKGKRRRKGGKGTPQGIEKMLQKGQEVLVQITRESFSTKGPSLTNYVSLPGRYLVLMPAVRKLGVSRKIRDEKERKELRKALETLNPPEEFGFIIRTAGIGRRQEELRFDLNYLLRLWEAVLSRTKKVGAPEVIYRESDLVIRAIRDYLYDDVDELWIDSEKEHGRAVEFLEAVMPPFAQKAKYYSDSDPLFHHFGLDVELDRLYSKDVPLSSGGSIVIEQTEAMVTVDVNTGRYRGREDSREMILSTNLEAAEEIARQLRLRDLGGMIMLDFIDMQAAADRKRVEDTLRDCLSGDRARITQFPIGPLGILEMTRQRVRQSLKRKIFQSCPHCSGTGYVRSSEGAALEVIRRLRVLVEDRKGPAVKIRLHPGLALEVANAKRRSLCEIEIEKSIHLEICADGSLGMDQMEFAWLDDTVYDIE